MQFRSAMTELKSKMQAINPPWKKATAITPDPPAVWGTLPDPVAKVILQCWDTFDWRSSSDALSDWYNARILKTGYSVSRETIDSMLRSNGRDAHMGLGDHLEGAFYRREI